MRMDEGHETDDAPRACGAGDADARDGRDARDAREALEALEAREAQRELRATVAGLDAEGVEYESDG